MTLMVFFAQFYFLRDKNIEIVLSSNTISNLSRPTCAQVEALTFVRLKSVFRPPSVFIHIQSYNERKKQNQKKKRKKKLK